MQLAASISPDPSLKCTAEVVAASQLAAVDWDQVSLLLWQAPLPDARRGKQVQAFVDRGGSVDLLSRPRARRAASSSACAGRPGSSRRPEAPVESWRGDRRSAGPHRQRRSRCRSGSCRSGSTAGLSGEVTPLATLARRGAPAGAGHDQPRGGLLLRDHAGAGRFVAGHQRRRLLRSGPARAGRRGGGAGEHAPAHGRRAAARRPDRVEASGRRRRRRFRPTTRFTAGVYQDGERLLAVNRAAGEASAPVLADRRVAELFQGLDFARVDDKAGSLGSLIQEIWRLFLVAMMVAMVAEAALCLPKLARPRGAAS